MTIRSLLAWNPVAGWSMQRWVARQPRGVRFLVGSTSFVVATLVAVALVPWLGPVHVAGVVGGAVAMGLVTAWFPTPA